MRTRQYVNYDAYVQHQETKTLTVKDGSCNELRSFQERQNTFAKLFSVLEPKLPCRAICLGARRGEEVAALKNMGVDAIGIDLVPFRPLVHQGDIHDLPIWDKSVSLVYSNSIDHVLDLPQFAREVERVLQPGGLAMFHLQIGTWSDEVANQIDSVDEFFDLFSNMFIIDSRTVPTFLGGMNHVIVLEKT